MKSVDLEEDKERRGGCSRRRVNGGGRREDELTGVLGHTNSKIKNAFS